MMRKLKTISLFMLILFYLAGGINHFRNPDSYFKLIPSYLPYPTLLNILAGISEIGFALLLIPSRTRKFAAWGIILMLIAFLPVHISMIGDAPLKLGSISVTPLLAWVRLLLLQPLLILWAWWHASDKTSPSS
jgi:uncharacterized membrane protein